MAERRSSSGLYGRVAQDGRVAQQFGTAWPSGVKWSSGAAALVLLSEWRKMAEWHRCSGPHGRVITAQVWWLRDASLSLMYEVLDHLEMIWVFFNWLAPNSVLMVVVGVRLMHRVCGIFAHLVLDLTQCVK
jgi:hypothetical protein